MPKCRGVRKAVAWLGMSLAVGTFAHPAIAAREDDASQPKTLWSRSRTFRIPVTVPDKDRNLIKELILVASDDLGATWKSQKPTTPDRPQFSFRASHDGEYWFAVRTRDVNGKLYPPVADRPVEATLRVIVDTAKPTIVIDPRPRRGSDSGIRWEVQDDHLAPRSLTLEYQAEGAHEWKTVPLDPTEMKLIGLKTWDAGTADAIRVRMTARDKAGNVGVGEQLLTDGLAANPGPARENGVGMNPPSVRPIASQSSPTPSADQADDPFAGLDSGSGSSPPATKPTRGDVLPTQDDVDFGPPTATRDPNPAPATNAGADARGGPGPALQVANPRFPLRYEVQDAGPDGPAKVVLWITRDNGRSWSALPEDPDRTSPYKVDLGGEGTFGLWLEVRSASGLGDPAPVPGDAPQSFVEIDSTPPAVSLDRPRVGTGANAGKVALSWRSGDAHLTAKSVSLSYRADRPDAPWTPIADHLDNVGKMIWVVPAGVPPRFHVKAEAVDTLGNRGVADTLDFGPVLLDRARPRGRIIGLDQGATSRQ